MSLNSTAGGRVQQSAFGGLAPTPPPPQHGVIGSGLHHNGTLGTLNGAVSPHLSASAPTTVAVAPNTGRVHWPLQSLTVQQQQNVLSALYPGTAPSDLFHLVKCPMCHDHFRDPRVLACFHSFCKDCLESLDQTNNMSIKCPQCHQETQLSPNLGIDGLLSDYGLQNAVSQTVAQEGDSPTGQGNRAGSLSSSPGSESDDLVSV